MEEKHLLTIKNDWENRIHILDEKTHITADDIKSVEYNGKWYTPTIMDRFDSYSDCGHESTVRNRLMVIGKDGFTKVLDNGTYSIILKTEKDKAIEKLQSELKKQCQQVTLCQNKINYYVKARQTAENTMANIQIKLKELEGN